MKIFIVMLAIFSIVFSMLVIQFVAQTDNYRRIYQEAKQMADAEKISLHKAIAREAVA